MDLQLVEVVFDAGAPGEQARFWAQALGWDQGDETAIRAPDGTGPKVTWSGPVKPRWGRERLHLHLAPAPGSRVPAASTTCWRSAPPGPASLPPAPPRSR